MKSEKRHISYVDEMREYQSKQYLPGRFLGGNIHPALRAKTKAGGYAMLSAGIIFFYYTAIFLVRDFSYEFLGQAIVMMIIALLLVTVGFKFIKRNSSRKSTKK